MTAHDLLAELDQLGITCKAHGDRLRYSPRSAVTPDLAQRMKANKPALLASLAVEPSEPEISDDANEAHWQAIGEADRDYLLGPRNWPEPCAWCGGQLRHSKPCEDLRAEWQPTLPFGRYKGQRVSDAPTDYLQWLVSEHVDLSTEIRAAIETRLSILD